MYHKKKLLEKWNVFLMLHIGKVSKITYPGRNQNAFYLVDDKKVEFSVVDVPVRGITQKQLSRPHKIDFKHANQS